MEKAYGQARTLDLAKKNQKKYVRNVTAVYGAANGGTEDEKDSIAAANPGCNTCCFCGNIRHSRKNCPAHEAFVTNVKINVTLQKFISQKGVPGIELTYCDSGNTMHFSFFTMQFFPSTQQIMISKKVCFLNLGTKTKFFIAVEAAIAA